MTDKDPFALDLSTFTPRSLTIYDGETGETVYEADVIEGDSAEPTTKVTLRPDGVFVIDLDG